MSNLKPFGNKFYIFPLKVLYLFIVTIRNFLFNKIESLSKDLGFFTISVGGIHAGGTGKTPTAALIGEFIANELKASPLFLSRGYGRIEKDPVTVDIDEEADWKKTGDEPALLKSRVPQSRLAIGSNRINAFNLIKSKLPDNTVIILDDGFQHRKIKRDLEILCLPPNPFEDHLIPAGTLRESEKSISRADIIFLIGSKDTNVEMIKNRDKLLSIFPEKTVFILYTKAENWQNLKNGEKKSTISKEKNIAISAIARPKRFLNTLNNLGIKYFKSYTYPDHHVFTNNDLGKINFKGDEIILTTEKDAVRLSSLNLVNLPNIWYLNIILEFDDKDSRGEFCQLVTDLFHKRCKLVRGNE